MNNTGSKPQNLEYDEDVIDLRQLAAALWARAWLILLIGILCGAATFSYAKFVEAPKYQSHVMMYVNNINSNNTVNGSGTISTGELNAAQSLVETYLVILKTHSTLDDVLEQSGLSYTYEELSGFVSGAAVNDTEVFRVNVTCGNPEDAALLADTIADVLPGKIAEIVSGSDVMVVERAVVDYRKVSPSEKKYAMIGVLFGLMLCSGIIVAIELFDDRIQNSDYLIDGFEIPLLAAIPDLENQSAYSDGYPYYTYSDSKCGKKRKKGARR